MSPRPPCSVVRPQLSQRLLGSGACGSAGAGPREARSSPCSGDLFGSDGHDIDDQARTGTGPRVFAGCARGVNPAESTRDVDINIRFWFTKPRPGSPVGVCVVLVASPAQRPRADAGARWGTRSSTSVAACGRFVGRASCPVGGAWSVWGGGSACVWAVVAARDDLAASACAGGRFRGAGSAGSPSSVAHGSGHRRLACQSRRMCMLIPARANASRTAFLMVLKTRVYPRSILARWTLISALVDSTQLRRL